MKAKDLRFERTCWACPEQYDVFNENGDIVGYIRLRWGVLTCECPDCGGEVVYSEDFKEPFKGIFEDEDERSTRLSKCADAIIDYFNQDSD